MEDHADRNVVWKDVTVSAYKVGYVELSGKRRFCKFDHKLKYIVLSKCILAKEIIRV
jgi:hypothetical protein